MFVIDEDRAGLTAASALSLPQIFTWLGIQNMTIVLLSTVRWV